MTRNFMNNIKKYKMYIIDLGDWVTDYDSDYQISDGCCFVTGQWDIEHNRRKKPYKMSVKEVLWCIVDCAKNRDAYRYKIYPQREFLKEYEIFKRIDKVSFEKIKKEADGVDFNNILKIPKKVQRVGFVSINRNTLVDTNNMGRLESMTTYYNLTTEGVGDCPSMTKMKDVLVNKKEDLKYDFEEENKSLCSSMPIVGIEKKDDTYIIETIRTFYITKIIVGPANINTIEELKKYLKSDDYKKFIKLWKREESPHSKQKVNSGIETPFI